MTRPGLAWPLSIIGCCQTPVSAVKAARDSEAARAYRTDYRAAAPLLYAWRPRPRTAPC